MIGSIECHYLLLILLQDANHLEIQVNRMEGTLSGVHTRMNELWERKLQVDKELIALHEQMVEQNMTEPLAVEVLRQESAVR